ncbi:hypothetical protein CDD83_6630 [Cordyceps sp. RAO-2017]|nr:hypothetical protein CDD83_6630 [Cordyceps sp. RAO-2017]
MRESWERVRVKTRRKIWGPAILSTIRYHPEKTASVLEATLDPLPPSYAVRDVLAFVTKRLRRDAAATARERDQQAFQMLRLANKIIGMFPVWLLPVIEDAIGMLADALPVKHANQLYSSLTMRCPMLRRGTKLHFASKLARLAEYKPKALEILHELADQGMNLNCRASASIVTTLLKSFSEDGEKEGQEPRFSPPRALESLVKRGFSPNIITVTAFLDSLCEQGEVSEALRLGLVVVENGVELDRRAWLHLFRGAKSSVDVANVVKAFEVARVADAPEVDVLNQGLHSIFCFADSESRERMRHAPWVQPLFVPMLEVYALRFDLEPLQQWLPDSLPLLLTPTEEAGRARTWDFHQTVLPAVGEFFFSTEGPRVPPNATTIAVMLRAYIKSIDDPYKLLSFYQFFKSRLEEQEEKHIAARTLVETNGTLIHDGFILAIAGHRLLSRHAVQIFGDMLKGNVAAARGGETEGGQEEGQSAAGTAHPAPSAFTLTVLLRTLLINREQFLARQIIEILDELDIEPKLEMWNTLLKGYALQQDVQEAVQLLHGMEATGLQPDASTFRAFALLHQQGRALRMMERMIERSRRTMPASELQALRDLGGDVPPKTRPVTADMLPPPAAASR